MSEVIQDQENLDDAFENVVEKVTPKVERPELDADGKPVDVEILSMGHIRGELANYEWRTVTIDGKKVAVKILKGDPYDHMMLLGKDDVAYMAALAKDNEHQEDVEKQISDMDEVTQVELAGFNKRNEEAIVVAYILEPKFCLDSDPKPGAIPVSELSYEGRIALVDAYNDVVVPQEVIETTERFQ